MKQFALFICDRYYPSGGWLDLIDCYDTLDAAKIAAEDKKNSKYASVADWHIVDLSLQTIVSEGTRK